MGTRREGENGQWRGEGGVVVRICAGEEGARIVTRSDTVSICSTGCMLRFVCNLGYIGFVFV